MIKTFALFLFAVVVSGCSTQKYYVKQGGSLEEFNRTLAGCHNQAYMLPKSQFVNPFPPGLYAPSYQVQSNVNSLTGSVSTTATPFMNPYATIGHGLMALGDAMQELEIRERFLENCMVANGWMRTTKEEVTITVPTRAIVGEPSKSYTGKATGYLGGHGTLEVASSDGRQCVGTFRHTKPGTGVVVLRCDDGDTAEMDFTTLSRTSGFGSGVSKMGRSVKFVYGNDLDLKEFDLRIPVR